MNRLDKLTGSSEGSILRVRPGCLASCAITVTLVYQPVAVLGTVGVILILIVGLVLPAVWSRQSARRAAALRVLQLLMPRLALSHSTGTSRSQAGASSESAAPADSPRTQYED